MYDIPIPTSFLFDHTFLFTLIMTLILSLTISLRQEITFYNWIYCYFSSLFFIFFRRSLRIISALARGTPIVSQDWFYACLSEQRWVDTIPYLHCHYSKNQILQGFKMQRTFLNLKFFLGYSKNPSQLYVENILKSSGGKITKNLSESDFFVFGKNLHVLKIFLSTIFSS